MSSSKIESLSVVLIQCWIDAPVDTQGRGDRADTGATPADCERDLEGQMKTVALSGGERQKRVSRCDGGGGCEVVTRRARC